MSAPADTPARPWWSAAVVAAALSGTPALAEEPSRVGVTAAFVQAGVAQKATMLILGATWDWRWRRQTSWGTFSGYWDASFGRWSSSRPQANGSAWVTQLGVTPVLRLHPGGWGDGWFVEAGIGANFLLPVYRNAGKRFSTAFNFGDHLAIGKRFGRPGRHELALRIQHFSNAGIRHPNPGENFLQLRYATLF